MVKFGVHFGIGAGACSGLMLRGSGWGWGGDLTFRGHTDLGTGCIVVSSEPSFPPRTSSKPSSTHRAHRLRCRMMGLSQPSSSNSSRSGQCLTGPQASAKPTPWALWVRAHTSLLPFRIPLFHTHLTLALSSMVGTESPADQKAPVVTKKRRAKNDLSFMWNGVEPPQGTENLLSRQYLLRARGMPGAGGGVQMKGQCGASLHHHGLPVKLGSKVVLEV